MRFALYTNVVSPHQLPLAREIINRLGAANYRYVYTEPLMRSRMDMGWHQDDEPWILKYGTEEATEWLNDADVVFMQHNRDWDLIESRLERGKGCLYASERWFKPLSLFRMFFKGSDRFEIDGICRMLSPRYRKMAHRFMSLVGKYERFRIMPIGIHAKNDFMRLGILEGRMMDWGYFVCDSERKMANRGEEMKTMKSGNGINVLWVGSIYGLKKVDTIVKACAKANENRQMGLTLVGDGPERGRIERLVENLGIGSRVNFMSSVPIAKVRSLMRENDVFVLASDGQEGWGAVLSEALEEGMSCIGTYEAGSSATILPAERLFHAGDWKKLAELLVKVETLPQVDFSKWTVHAAADRLFSFL